MRFVFFFFFKQKTAYELRISDWSSDVCSSDLCYCPLWNKVCIFDAGMAHNDIKRYDVKKIVIILLSFFYYSVNGQQTPDSLRTDTARAEIGRASCRESVCQYV